MKGIVLIISILFFSIYTPAQKDVCLGDVEEVYRVWTKQIEENKSGFYLKYNYEVQVKSSNGINKNAAIMELISHENNSVFQTNNLNVYQDKKHTVTVMDDKKLIIINSYVGDAYKQEKIGQFQLLKDSMFQMLTTQQCDDINFKGSTYKRVLLKANDKAKKAYNIKTIEFLLDEELKRIKKVLINYVDGYKVYAMQMEIITQKLNYQQSSIKKEVLNNVFNSDGRLLKKYSTYQLIDNRN